LRRRRPPRRIRSIPISPSRCARHHPQRHHPRLRQGDQGGRYGTTITAPHLFKTYLIEQLTLLADNYQAAIYVGKSRDPIPLTFAVERAAAQMNAEQRLRMAERFPMPRLDTAPDAIVDGAVWTGPGPAPLSLFSAERIDFSLHRLRHYTGTEPELFQSFVLFTTTSATSMSSRLLRQGGRGGRARNYRAGRAHHGQGLRARRPALAKPPQMPAYHLVQDNGDGITLVNIGWASTPRPSPIIWRCCGRMCG